AWYGAAVGMGMLVGGKTTVLRVAGASLASSVSFFLVSNFAVWTAWEMYPKTLNGLAMCYAAAVPFFRNTVASDLMFTAVAFSIPVLLELLSPKTAKDSIVA
ncbi:MAG TPA: DUF6580 family putative transport protein, partial [Clostridia bacterium]|nr:DUF6580 family putative transport protein [Clostridia bacterium]